MPASRIEPHVSTHPEGVHKDVLVYAAQRMMTLARGRNGVAPLAFAFQWDAEPFVTRVSHFSGGTSVHVYTPNGVDVGYIEVFGWSE